MKQIVLFGGTFDPPHIGHLVMAQLAYEQSGCDEVWVMPSPTPPHKQGETRTPFDVRVDMVRRLIHGHKGLVLSVVEAERSEPSYTVDTVRILQSRYQDVTFRFLIGSDSLRDLPTWHGSLELTERIEFLVASRAEAPFLETYSAVKQVLPQLRAELVKMPMLDVSSSFIRQRVAADLPLCGLVPDTVLDVWKQHR